MMKNWQRSLARAVTTWGIARFVLSLWGYTIWRMGFIQAGAGRDWLHGIVPASEGYQAALVDIWLRWDTVHYLRIIQSGYGPDERSAFFPVYPFLGKVFGDILGGDPLLGLLFVSNLAAIGSLLLIEKLAQGLPLQTRFPIVTQIVFYPMAFFLLVAYPQSLVLFFCLAAYLAMRANRLLLALSLGLITGLTHTTALALAMLLIMNARSSGSVRGLRILVASGPVLGIIMFMAWRAYMGLPSYQELQWAMSSRSIGIGIDLEGVMTPGVWLLRGWPNLFALILGVCCVIWAYRVRRFDWAVFQATILLIPVVTAPVFEPLDGLARYALVGFPLYFALSQWLPRGWKRSILSALTIGANLYLSGIFIMWGFVG